MTNCANYEKVTSMNIQTHLGMYEAPFGVLEIEVSHLGLRKLTFAESHMMPTASGNHFLDEVCKQLSEYFSGHRCEFDLAIDLHGTDFQVEAWRALAEVPFGTTATYAQQAASIGRPRATRAIGAANGRNPVAVVLPCHRIIGANGSLTGFAGGLHVKSWLLQHEQDVLARR
jgi:methylated-DNA-[protein]-cysteine S-methyltransferase